MHGDKNLNFMFVSVIYVGLSNSVQIFQATSVLGHKRRNPEPAVLPTSDAERQGFHRDHSLASDFDRKIEELDTHFDKVTIYLSDINHIYAVIGFIEL